MKSPVVAITFLACLLLVGCATNRVTSSPDGERVANTPEGRPVTYRIKQDGKGKQVRPGADNDIHSRPFGLTVAGFNSELRWNESSVWIKYDYSSVEVGGDRTTIEGENKITVATARPGYRIVDVDSYGRTEVGHGRSYRGTVRNPPLLSNVGYWSNVSMFIDTEFENDVRYIGLMGNLRFKVYEVKL